jgi:hypothetical protein
MRTSVAVLALVATLADSSVALAKPWTISGVVLGDVDGLPVSGLEIQLTKFRGPPFWCFWCMGGWRQFKATRTDANGHFSFSNVTRGDFSLQADCANGAPALYQRIGELTADLNVTLKFKHSNCVPWR